MSGNEEENPADFLKIAIVGCNGRMGSMLMERARNSSMEVCGVDRPLETSSVQECINKAKIVIVCVPAAVFSEVLEKIIPFMTKDAILSDITSVKEKPLKQMEAAWKGNVVGAHPLFGPKTQGELRVAITPGKDADKKSVELVESFYRDIGCEVFTTEASLHDWAMARIQNMNFITNLAYFAVLADQKELLPFLTPSFERRKKAAAKMLNEDAEMFAGLFEANSHSHEAVREYRKMLNVAASGDIEVLCKRAQLWWDGESTHKD